MIYIYFTWLLLDHSYEQTTQWFPVPHSPSATETSTKLIKPQVCSQCSTWLNHWCVMPHCPNNSAPHSLYFPTPATCHSCQLFTLLFLSTGKGFRSVLLKRVHISPSCTCAAKFENDTDFTLFLCSWCSFFFFDVILSCSVWGCLCAEGIIQRLFIYEHLSL